MAEGRWDTLEDLRNARQPKKPPAPRPKQTRSYDRPAPAKQLYGAAVVAVQNLLRDGQWHSDLELQTVAAKKLSTETRWMRYRAVNSVVMVRNSINPDYEMDATGDDVRWRLRSIHERTAFGCADVSVLCVRNPDVAVVDPSES